MRRFRGLREAPRDRYDAVVIGSGIGGLVAANLLARGGLSVLMVEQHYMTGGFCSTFRRRGFTFDASTHFYPLLGNRETLTGRLIAELGVETRWLRMDPVDTFHFPDGSRFEVPVDLDSYLRKVKARFPEESAGLDEFFAAAREAYALGLVAHFRGRPPERLARIEGWTVRDALDRYIRDPRLKLLLCADCAHWGSPPCRTSFVFDSMLRLAYFLGNYYPAGGSQAFADELARCFEERGGDILMSTHAHRIHTAGGRATAVELETTRGPRRGRHLVRAGFVVANGDLTAALRDLLAQPESAPGVEAAVPPDPEELAMRARLGRQLERVSRLRLSYPCFLTHLGLRDCDAAELERAQGYYWDGWDPDQVGRGGLRFKIFVPTLLEPALAPPGGHIIILQKVLEMDCAAVTDWPAHKAAVEGFLLEQLERVMPGARARIVAQSSASARTAQRFTLNRDGAMLGWEMSPQQVGAERPGTDSPLPNLFFVGHWTRPGGGITPVIASAQKVAADILAAPVAPPQPAATAGPAAAH